MKPSSKTYWCSGGDLLAGQGRRIDEDDACALRALHLDEAAAAARAGAALAQSAGLRMAAELDAALTLMRRWRRAATHAHFK